MKNSKKGLKKIYHFLKREESWISYLVLFLIAFTFLAFLQYNNGFACPDSYYHTKMAMLIRDHGIVKDFPWLQFTIFKNYFIDHHFLYHLSLVPFVTFLDPIIGVKLATVLFASLCVLVFYMFLRKQKVKFAFIFGIILLLITPFTFRVSLARVPSLSILTLIIALYLIFHYRYWWLFFVSFLYVWLYDGFPLLLVFSFIFMVVDIFFSFLEKRKRRHLSLEEGKENKIKAFFRMKGVKIFLVSLSGIIAGIIINPYFPKNLYFYWIHIIKIGVVNYQKIIGVGAEWYPYKFIDLISNTVLGTILLIVAIVLFFISIRRQKRFSVTLMLIYLFFFAFTLRSKRNVEYYVPFALLFAATVIGPFLAKLNFKEIFDSVLRFYFKRKIFTTIILIYIFVTLPTIIIRDVTSTKNDLASGWPYTKFSKANNWLIENSPEGSIVMHSSWDEFPLLFFHNTHNYFIVGLDTTFMYEYSKDLYWKWVELTHGRPSGEMYNILKNNFHSSYVFVEANHYEMKQAMEDDPKIDLVYSDSEAYVYKLKD